MHLSDTAKRFNMGTKTFSRLFDKEVGMTYYQFVKNARIMKGIELILEKKLSIQEIAYEVGYSSIAAFSNAFFKETTKDQQNIEVYNMYVIFNIIALFLVLKLSN